ncbi:MAG: hypothetical protein QF408_14025, partial [Pirellulales bacterium]|nr:hypothetical protein [Pirellulales bacterium]
IAQLREMINDSDRKNRLYNSIGVLYARYGLYENAKREFENALQSGEYSPALINLANMELLSRRLV